MKNHLEIFVMFLVATAMLVVMTEPAPGQELSLDSYLQQVKKRNGGFLSNESKATASNDAKSSAEIRFSPQVFSTVSTTNDKSPRQNNIIQGEESKSQNYTIGISKENRYGTNASVSYGINRMETVGADPQFLSDPTIYTNSVNVEVSQSLWKNAFGSSSRNEENSIIANFEAESLSEQFKGVNALVEAEQRYWDLAFAQRFKKVYEDSLERSSKILQYNKSRYKKNLVDKADVLQAEATWELRKLELESAIGDLKQASLRFNLSRGVASDNVPERLASPRIGDISNLSISKPAQDRLDVSAARKLAEAASLTAEVEEDKYKPDLSIYTNAVLAGQDPRFSPATDDSFSSNNPKVEIGLRFSMILDRDLVKRASSSKSGYARASKLNADYLALEQNVEWNNLTRKFQTAQKKMSISESIEKAQKNRFDNEKLLQKSGRSTTYQVLLSEQDYLNAQLTKLRLMSELLSIHAQAKKFGGQP